MSHVWKSANLLKRCLLVGCTMLLLSIGYICSSFGNISGTQKFFSRLQSITLTPVENVSLYYRHATSARNSSFPYASGDTFRAFADYVFDETKRDDVSSVAYGGLIFVKADMISEFFGSPFDSIRQPFVLITHNSDVNAPERLRTHLSNPKILAWYTTNPSEKDHPKLKSLPISVANTRWPQGNLTEITYAFNNQRKPWAERSRLLYVSFSLNTNPAQRKKALEQAKTIENVDIVQGRTTFRTHLENLGNTKFVLSPPGNGLDCHRSWEALLMGAVPIVMASTLDSLFRNTTALILDDWSKLTTALLQSYTVPTVKEGLPDVLSARYWHKVFLSHRNSSPPHA